MSNVVATFTADITGYQSAMKHLKGDTVSATGKASSSILGGGKSFLKMGALAGVGAGIVTKALQTMGSMTTSIVSRFDTLNNANRTFKNMGFATADTKKAMSGLNASIMGLPTSLDQAVQGMELMAASTGDVQKGQKVFSAVNDAVLGFGGSSAQASSAVQQLSQDLSSGTITAATWNSMINDGMGPALKALATSMGMTSGQLKDALSKGKVSANQFSDALINMDKNGGGGMKSLHKIALDSTSGISSSFANLKTAVVRGSANMLTVVDDFIKSVTGTDISGWIKQAASVVTSGMASASNAIKSFTPVAKSIFDTLKSLVGWVAKNKDWLLPLVAGITTFVVTFKSIMTVISIINSVKSAFSALSAIFMANPIVLVVAAIAALVAGLVVFFTKTKTGQKIWAGFVKWLKGAWEGLKTTATSVWNAITDAVSGAVEGVQNAWNGIADYFTGLWNGIKTTAENVWGSISDFFSGIWQGIVDTAMGIWNTFGPGLTEIWNGIVSIATGVWNMLKAVIMGPILLVLDFLTGSWTQMGTDLSTIWTSIKDAAASIWNGLVSYFSGILDTIGAYFSTVWNAIKGVAVSVWNGIKSFFVGLWNGIVSTARGIFDGLSSFMSGLWNGIKSTAISLWNGLKSGVVNIAKGIFEGAKSAWSGFTGMVSRVVDGVKGAFNALTHIDLLKAGKAIIDGFISGLTSAWEAGKKFVGGIADWIRKHKGPISYDARLLIPAGSAIMAGLNQGLQASFGNVQKTVSGMASDISASVASVAGSMSVGNMAFATPDVNQGDTVQSIDNSERVQPTFYVYNEMVGDKIRTSVKKGDKEQQINGEFFR